MPDGVEITEPSTILYRQVASLHWQNEKVSSAAFIPGPDHNSLLSTRHEDVTAARAYDDFKNAGHDTVGTWAVTVGEISENTVHKGVKSYLDGGIGDAPEGHVSVDYSAIPSPSATKRFARTLARAATDRGCAHGPFGADDLGQDDQTLPKDSPPPEG